MLGQRDRARKSRQRDLQPRLRKQVRRKLLQREWRTIAKDKGGAPHVNESDEAELSIDYAFMTKEGQVELEKTMQEQDKVGACPVLVGSDHRSKAVWAMVVNEKKPTESAVKWIVGKVDKAGCCGIRVVLKSDQAESVVALKKAVAI